MSIQFFSDESFSAGSQLDPVDTFVGDGTTKTFVLVNKSVQRLGATIQVGGTLYNFYNGDFTVSIAGNSFTLNTAPPANSLIVAPGITQLVSAAFDQSIVPGVTNPRVSQVPFYMGDIQNINSQYYIGYPTFAGIEISLNNLVSSIGAQTSWCQLACSDPVLGTALTYLPTATNLYTGPVSAFTTVSASAVAGASSVLCVTPSSFAIGDYVYLNFGTVTQEVRKISSLTASSMNFTGRFNYSHFIGETIYTIGRKFWLQVTVPVNAANNLPTSFYNLSLRGRGRIVSRV